MKQPYFPKLTLEQYISGPCHGVQAEAGRRLGISSNQVSLWLHAGRRTHTKMTRKLKRLGIIPPNQEKI